MPDDTADFRTLGPSDELPNDYVVPYYLDDLKIRVSVALVADRLYGFDDLCTHEGCPLSAGLLTGSVIMCQCHGSRFDVTTGAVVNGPATEPLGVHEVRELDGNIQARL
jgi:nitrite reductase/ring-hydroxylating ferredoxin subunit